MISTIETRQAQLECGYFQSGSGPEMIFILGSCRTLAFLNYLIRWNIGEGKNRFTIRRIDVCDTNWNSQGQVVDNVPILKAMETDERILSTLESASIFIHEHMGNYGMFNTDRGSESNVYQFGMNATTDISIPNFHDRFVLYMDFCDFHALTDDWAQKGERAIQEFVDLCVLTSFPEFGAYFKENWRTTRFFWRPNHTSAAFTLEIFRLMNERFLGLPLSEEFWAGARTEDQFAHPNTSMTQADIDAYKLTWR